MMRQTPLLAWGLPLLALLLTFWLSLFCWSPVPVSPWQALSALFPGGPLHAAGAGA